MYKSKKNVDILCCFAKTWVTLGVTVTMWLKDHAEILAKRVMVTRVRHGMARSILGAWRPRIRG